MTTSISNQPTASSLGLTQNVLTAVQDYVAAHEAAWDAELSTQDKVSKFIRHAHSGLPFSIEYWKDKTCLAYPKGSFSSGVSKKMEYAVDIKGAIVYARAKARSRLTYCCIQEAKTIASFAGVHGVIQNLQTSFYPSKNDHGEMKFHMIQELYEGNFFDLEQRKVSEQELKTIVLDLMKGLKAIHDKGMCHNDLWRGNILFQVHEGLVTKCILVDLGDAASAYKDSCFGEVSKLLALFQSLYLAQQLPVPPVILKLLNRVTVVNYMYQSTISAPEALEKLTEHYHSI